MDRHVSGMELYLLLIPESAQKRVEAFAVVQSGVGHDVTQLEDLIEAIIWLLELRGDVYPLAEGCVQDFRCLFGVPIGLFHEECHALPVVQLSEVHLLRHVVLPICAVLPPAAFRCVSVPSGS